MEHLVVTRKKRGINANFAICALNFRNLACRFPFLEKNHEFGHKILKLGVRFKN